MTTQEIAERIMSAHWDIKACTCWVCVKGREAGCRPREYFLQHENDNRKNFPVPLSNFFKP